MLKIYEKNQTQNFSNSAPVTTFLILDRTFDAVTPLIRDFHYMPLMYEYKNVKNHKIPQSSSSKNKKKTKDFNENDPIFEKYKF